MFDCIAFWELILVVKKTSFDGMDIYVLALVLAYDCGAFFRWVEQQFSYTYTPAQR